VRCCVKRLLHRLAGRWLDINEWVQHGRRQRLVHVQCCSPQKALVIIRSPSSPVMPGALVRCVHCREYSAPGANWLHATGVCVHNRPRLKILPFSDVELRTASGSHERRQLVTDNLRLSVSLPICPRCFCSCNGRVCLLSTYEQTGRPA
jgi:hypothetical protein